MRIEIQASLILAGLVAVLSILVHATGLTASFMTGQLVFLIGAVVINIGVVYWALTKTAAESSYGRQLLRAVLIGVIGGVLIVIASWLILSVVFPDAIDDLRQAGVEYLRERGTPPEEFQRQLEVLESTTALSQSISGGIGTFFTSLVVGAAVAIFRRKQSAQS